MYGFTNRLAKAVTWHIADLVIDSMAANMGYAMPFRTVPGNATDVGGVKTIFYFNLLLLPKS